MAVDMPKLPTRIAVTVPPGTGKSPSYRRDASGCFTRTRASNNKQDEQQLSGTASVSHRFRRILRCSHTHSCHEIVRVIIQHIEYAGVVKTKKQKTKKKNTQKKKK